MLMKESGESLGLEPMRESNMAGESVDQTEEQKREEVMSRPFLGVDSSGNLTLHIPLPKTDELVARGILDKAHSMAVEYFNRRAREQAEDQRKMAALAAKTGYGRFADKLAGMLKR